MCLEHRLPKNKANKIIDKIPPEGIKVYKIVKCGSVHYHPIHRYEFGPYNEGVNKAQTKQISAWEGEKYMAGFHFYMNEKNAKYILNKEWGDSVYTFKLIECIVKKSWITAIGHEVVFKTVHGDFDDVYLTTTVIVAKKAIFPKFCGENK
jgi:hypothetical protein